VKRGALYESTTTERWRRDLEHLGTDADKPHQEMTPALIVVFAKSHR
jgi:hypothetical protein